MWEKVWSVLTKLFGRSQATQAFIQAIKSSQEMLRIERDERDRLVERFQREIELLDARLRVCEERWENFERLRSFVDSQDLPHVNAIILIDEHGLIKEWNEAATKMFGWENPEAMGKDVTMLIPPRLRSRHLQGFNKASKEKKILSSVDMEVIGVHAMGFEMRLMVELSSWINKDGEMRFSAELRRKTAR